MRPCGSRRPSTKITLSGGEAPLTPRNVHRHGPGRRGALKGPRRSPQHGERGTARRRALSGSGGSGGTCCPRLHRQRPRGKSCVGWARARPAPPVAAFDVALQGLLPRGRGNEGSRDEGGAPCQSLKCPCCIVTTFSAGIEDRERIGTMAEAPREQPGTMRIATAIATGQCGTGTAGQARTGAGRC